MLDQDARVWKYSAESSNLTTPASYLQTRCRMSCLWLSAVDNFSAWNQTQINLHWLIISGKNQRKITYVHTGISLHDVISELSLEKKLNRAGGNGRCMWYKSWKLWLIMNLLLLFENPVFANILILITICRSRNDSMENSRHSCLSVLDHSPKASRRGGENRRKTCQVRVKKPGK